MNHRLGKIWYTCVGNFGIPTIHPFARSRVTFLTVFCFINLASDLLQRLQTSSGAIVSIQLHSGNLPLKAG